MLRRVIDTIYPGLLTDLTRVSIVVAVEWDPCDTYHCNKDSPEKDALRENLLITRVTIGNAVCEVCCLDVLNTQDWVSLQEPASHG